MRGSQEGALVTQRSPYEVLGITPDADADQIAAAYRGLARRVHPDVSRDPDAQQHMAELNGAWAVLRDPVRRAQWDMANLPGGARGGAAPGTAGSGSRTAGPPGSVRPGAPNAGPGGPGGAGGGHGAQAGTQPDRVAWRRGPDGVGAAGPPPGPRSGTVLPFGRHLGWSIGEIARADPGYLVWLKDRHEGAPYRAEIERVLTAMFPATFGGTRPGPRRRGVR